MKNIDTVIVGLGTTGLSVARYLSNQNREFAVVDSRQTPPCADELFSLNDSDTTHHFGDFDTPLLTNAKQIVINPGIAVATPEIVAAKQAGVEVLGDIELFCRAVYSNPTTQPVIAITGSNGKTTVTTLLDLMAKESGVEVGTGGNIGTPALDLLSGLDKELFILELSSYQLETTPSLQTLAAVILNLSEDHLDRYDNDLEQYAEAKALIYNNCQHVIYNREDEYSTRFAILTATNENTVSFGLDKPKTGQYGLQIQNNIEWLAKGDDLLIPVSEVKQIGKHNIANSLAALALGEVAGLKMSSMLKVLSEFAGMEHRTQWVSELNKVNFYNDSKGTNVGATLSALSGLSGKTVLIAGGQAKGADFLPLQSVILEKARAVVLIGEDAEKISAVVDDSVPQMFVNTMQEAVEKAYAFADKEAGDNVLLSPACASFDMYENYIKRGQVFIESVNNLEQQLHNKLQDGDQHA
ncbi:MAG: UDP-N-acetylmuramoyl-L-alanine--D-glutamate ligase [Cocleimonas sp.]